MQYKRFESGSVLIISCFLILIVSIICLSLWNLLNYKIFLVAQKEQQLKAYLAAKAGMEDAIHEFVQGNSWNFHDAEINNNWIYIADNHYYRTNVSSDDLSYFDYNVTYSVQLEGDIDTQLSTINVNSIVSNKNSSAQYKYTLQANISRTFDGKMIIHNMTEDPNG